MILNTPNGVLIDVLIRIYDKDIQNISLVNKRLNVICKKYVWKQKCKIDFNEPFIKLPEPRENHYGKEYIFI